MCLAAGKRDFKDAVYGNENFDPGLIYEALDYCNNANRIAFKILDSNLEARSEA